MYADTSPNTLDDPKVETLAEFIRKSRPGMCIGVVTTAEVQDATPAAMYSHTRSRDDKSMITDMMINGAKINKLPWDAKPVKADVFLGGGGAYFCRKGEKDGQKCKSLNSTDYYKTYAEHGYKVVHSKNELESYHGKEPIVGIFHLSHMDAWLDRIVYPENIELAKMSPDGNERVANEQPGLELMTMKAIELMSSNERCSDGFFLLAEAASIDKHMHNMDFDRGLSELLELDRTVKAVGDWAKKHASNGETAIVVTADHGHAYDVYGSVDTHYFDTQPAEDSGKVKDIVGVESQLSVSKRQAIGVYAESGWPDLVTDELGLPTKWENRFRLAQGKVDKLAYKEDFKLAKLPDPKKTPMSRNTVVINEKFTKAFGDKVYSPTPDVKGLLQLPNSAPFERDTGHSLQAVDLYCGGPAAFRMLCARVMDNTELFFVMAETLGLGSATSYSVPQNKREEINSGSSYLRQSNQEKEKSQSHPTIYSSSASLSAIGSWMMSLIISFY